MPKGLKAESWKTQLNPLDLPRVQKRIVWSSMTYWSLNGYHKKVFIVDLFWNKLRQSLRSQKRQTYSGRSFSTLGNISDLRVHHTSFYNDTDTQIPASWFSDPSDLREPNCCGSGSLRHPNCLPVSLPPDDQFYRLYRQTCMNMLRSLAGVRQDCRLGEQIMSRITFVHISVPHTRIIYS